MKAKIFLLISYSVLRRAGINAFLTDWSRKDDNITRATSKVTYLRQIQVKDALASLAVHSMDNLEPFFFISVVKVCKNFESKSG